MYVMHVVYHSDLKSNPTLIKEGIYEGFVSDSGFHEYKLSFYHNKY